jgi:hypothetical protein
MKNEHLQLQMQVIDTFTAYMYMHELKLPGLMTDFPLVYNLVHKSVGTSCSLVSLQK